MQLNAKFGILSEARLNAPAGICIVCGPCMVTGEVLKWKVIVALPLLKADGVRRNSVHREIAGLDSCRIHRVGQVDNEVHRLGADDAVASRSSGGHGKTHQLSIGEGILLGWPLMALRPSAHEVTCLVSIAEP